LERRATELRDKVDKLARGDRIRVRASGATYDVNFDSKNVEAETVDYVFDDGCVPLLARPLGSYSRLPLTLLRPHSKRASVKWKMIVWPDSPEKQRKKEEAAARAERERMAIFDRPAYRAPAKRSSGSNTPAALPAVAPIQPPTRAQEEAHVQVPARPHPAVQPFYGAAPSQPQPAAAAYPQAYHSAPPAHVHAHAPAYGYPPSHSAPPPRPTGYGHAPAYQQQPQQHYPSPQSVYYPQQPQQQPPRQGYPGMPHAQHATQALPPFSSAAAAAQAPPPPHHHHHQQQ